MKTKWYKSVIVALAMSLVGIVSADNTWTGAGGNDLWTTPGNWSAGHAPVNSDLNLFLGAGSDTGNDLIIVDSSMNISVNCDLYGPEWGLHLDIDGGSLTQVYNTPVAGEGFVFAPIADAGVHSVIDVRNGGTLHVQELLIGDNWWFAGHPYVDLNVSDNSTVIANGWCWLGGRINLYSGVIDIGGSMNFATGNGYAHINIENGTLIIRDVAFTAATAQAWEDGGFLTGFGGQGDVIIDDSTGDVIITAAPSRAARDPNPTPLNEDGSVGTLISQTQAQVTLNWKAGYDPNTESGNPFDPNIKTHYVYLGTSQETLALIATVPQTSPIDPQQSYGPVTLSENTLYYWRIEEGMDNGTGNPYPSGDPNNVLGPIWSFNTIGATPVIETQPQNAIANPNASFTITASEIANAYQWFKVSIPADIQLTDSGAYSGTTTATLTVTNATLAEEGQYYCIAYNGITPSLPSASAYLWIQRLIGHWKFDDSMADSVADTVAGAPAHIGAIVGVDPNYAAGINGSAMQFFNDGDYVAISDADYFNFYPLGFTMSYWYKETSAAGWRLPVSKLDAGTAGWLTGVDSGFRNQIVCFFETDNDPALWADGNADINVGDGNWHMITATYDPADNTLTMFTDGDENESVVVDLAGDPLAAAALSIGGRDTENSVDGFIDDVQIYSYPLSPLEIAQLYIAFEPSKWVCVEESGNPLNAYDINGDCLVNLADFAEFASKWLQCQRYPASACE